MAGRTQPSAASAKSQRPSSTRSWWRCMPRSSDGRTSSESALDLLFSAAQGTSMSSGSRAGSQQGQPTFQSRSVERNVEPERFQHGRLGSGSRLRVCREVLGLRGEALEGAPENGAREGGEAGPEEPLQDALAPGGGAGGGGAQGEGAESQDAGQQRPDHPDGQASHRRPETLPAQARVSAEEARGGLGHGGRGRGGAGEDAAGDAPRGGPGQVAPLASRRGRGS